MSWKNAPITITLTGSDPNNPALSLNYNIVNWPTNGQLNTINTSPNQFTYLPNNGFLGIDNFNFTVTNSGGLTLTEADVTIYVIGITIDENPQSIPAGAIANDPNNQTTITVSVVPYDQVNDVNITIKSTSPTTPSGIIAPIISDVNFDTNNGTAIATVTSGNLANQTVVLAITLNGIEIDESLAITLPNYSQINTSNLNLFNDGQSYDIMTESIKAANGNGLANHYVNWYLHIY